VWIVQEGAVVVCSALDFSTHANHGVAPATVACSDIRTVPTPSIRAIRLEIVRDQGMPIPARQVQQPSGASDHA
jgi:hypothetical protein